MRYDDPMPTAKTWLLLLALAMAGACDETLETGYKPRLLNATDADRRAYYAPEFSPEAHPAKDKNTGPDLGGQGY
jgi:hypothetical protein